MENKDPEITLYEKKIKALYLLAYPLSKAVVSIFHKNGFYYLKVFVGNTSSCLIKEKLKSLDACAEYISYYINGVVTFRISEYNAVLSYLDNQILKLIEKRTALFQESTTYVNSLKENSYRKVNKYEQS